MRAEALAHAAHLPGATKGEATWSPATLGLIGFVALLVISKALWSCVACIEAKSRRRRDDITDMELVRNMREGEDAKEVDDDL